MRDPNSSVSKPVALTRFFYAAALFTASAAALTGCQGTSSGGINQFSVPTDRPALSVSKFATQPDMPSSQWSTMIHPLFNHARSLVERHTGQNLGNVTLRVANDFSITEEVSHETQRLIHNQFNNRRFANQFLESVMKGQTGTYAALYATRTSEVMVSQPLMQSYQQSLPADPTTQQAALLALLIHELVHAADDRRYKIHENRDLNFRASFAQSAAFEGHAQWVTRKICQQAGCSSGLNALDEFMFGSRNPPNQLTQTVQAVSRNVLEYSYIEGERFVSSLASKPNGQQLIDRLLSNPPKDPIQILDPDSFPNTKRESRNQQLISASDSIDHPWLKSPWTSVETSPLKGVNLRTDPTRRNAAVDGFTRLITSMVAMQLYDQSAPGKAPIELTVIKADSIETADLFAKTLHRNTQINDAKLSSQERSFKVSGASQQAMLYLSKEPSDNNQTYYTLVGVSGLHVVQISGLGESESLFIDYIDKLLVKLTNNTGVPLASNAS